MKRVLFAGLVVTLIPGFAQAVIIARPLTGASALAHDDDGGAPAKVLDVKVSSQAFAPGTFTSATNPLSPLSKDFPFNPTKFAALTAADLASNWIYAYQLESLLPPAGATTEAIGTFNLGISGAPITSVGQEAGGGEVAADFATASANSVVFSFPGIAPGGTSSVLLIASPNAPGQSGFNVLDTSLEAPGNIPSPIPAPGAAVLALMGVGMVGRFRRRRA